MAKAIAEIEEITVVGIAAITVETEVEVTKVEDDLGRTITAETTFSQIKITKIQILIRIKIVSYNGQILIRKTFNKEILIKVHRKVHRCVCLQTHVTMQESVVLHFALSAGILRDTCTHSMTRLQTIET